MFTLKSINKYLSDRKLNNFLLQRQKMQPIDLVCKRDQIPAIDSQLWLLQKEDGNQYNLINKHTKKVLLKPHGAFIFVVLASDPHSIIIAKEYLYSSFNPTTYLDTNKYDLVEGHASISHKERVWAAGQLIFVEGHLQQWSNNSGHYQPSKIQIRHNLIPYLKLMLPKKLFKPIVF